MTIKPALLGAAWAYEVLLLWLLSRALTGEGARAALATLYPSLGAPPPERGYADECAASWPAVRAALVDVFTPAHLALWCALSLVLRDARVCWAGSVLFELGEMSFKHWLPNFDECWWDRALLDVLACNGAGIWLGCRARRALRLAPFDWAPLASARDAARAAALVALVLVGSLNSFFLKAALRVRVGCALNVWRLALWLALGARATAEFHERAA